MHAGAVLVASLLALAVPVPSGGDHAPERVAVGTGGCDTTLERRTVEPAVLLFRTDCSETAAATGPRSALAARRARRGRDEPDRAAMMRGSYGAVGP
jgi:hypothetical protein